MMPLTSILLNAVEDSALVLHTDAFYERDDSSHLQELHNHATLVTRALRGLQLNCDSRDSLVSALLTLSAYSALWAQHLDTRL